MHNLGHLQLVTANVQTRPSCRRLGIEHRNRWTLPNHIRARRQPVHARLARPWRGVEASVLHRPEIYSVIPLRVPGNASCIHALFNDNHYTGSRCLALTGPSYLCCSYLVRPLGERLGRSCQPRELSATKSIGDRLGTNASTNTAPSIYLLLTHPPQQQLPSSFDVGVVATSSSSSTHSKCDSGCSHNVSRSAPHVPPAHTIPSSATLLLLHQYP